MKEEVIDGIKYRLDEETLTAEVTYENDGEGDIIIPETVNFNGVIYRVTSIGDEAFSGCESLTSITIPDSVTSIGCGAFDNCELLDQKPTQEVEIDKLTYRLLMHNHLAMVVSRSEEPEAIDILSEIKYEGVVYRVTSIGNAAFTDCESLTSITIPDSVTSIGDSAFSSCESLTSITIPDSVTSIGDEAFFCCESLTSITIPDSVTNIGDRVFLGCDSLTSIVVAEGNTVYDSRDNCNAIIETTTNTLISACQKTTIPDSVTNIGDRAFSGCDSLTSIVVAEGNTVYDSRDNCSAIIETTTNTLISACQNTTIPDSVTSIGKGAFCNCMALTSVTIPSSVKSIGEDAFWNCKALTSITIPDSVTSIGDSAFSSCESLTSITIPDSVTNIGDRAFSGCESLTSITIPDSVTSIGDYAFSSCKSLTSITIPDSVTSIGTSAFRDCKVLTSVTIPSSVKSIGWGGTFQGCTSLKLVQWNAINCTIDINSDHSYYPPFYNLRSIKNFTFGNNVKSIPACLCYGLSGLTSITIPDGVTSIGYSAFLGCTSLKAIDIPDSVMIIERKAFWGCSSLKIIAIPSNVIIIEDLVFDTDDRSIAIRYRGTVEQLNQRYRYWDRCFFHGKTVYCTDDDKTVYF